MRTNPPTIGIVTITYNSGNVIHPFMESMITQTFKDFKLYIIDNISSDNTIAMIEKFRDPRVELIQNTENVGVAAGNNQGMRRAMEDGCPYIMLINNDVVFEETLFEKLLQSIQEHRDYALITCKMMYESDPERIWYAGSKWKKWKGYMAPHQGQKEIDKGQFDKIKTVDYAPTCMVMMQRAVIEKIGYMDEKYFAYYDDTDYFYRISKQSDFKILYYPDVQFYHKVGGLTQSKSGSMSRFKFGNFHIRLSTRNKVYYLKKQKSAIGYLNILYFLVRMNLRFLFSGKYRVNFETWRLLNASYLEGLKM